MRLNWSDLKELMNCVLATSIMDRRELGICHMCRFVHQNILLGVAKLVKQHVAHGSAFQLGKKAYFLNNNLT
jgi:hypothetical protein